MELALEYTKLLLLLLMFKETTWDKLQIRAKFNSLADHGIGTRTYKTTFIIINVLGDYMHYNKNWI